MRLLLLVAAALLAAPQIRADDAVPAPPGGPAGQVETALPVILGADDRARYREIFAAQDAARWRDADRLMRELDNKLLLGHVLYQRYMHPTGWRSTFAELKSWLAAYGDHPGAARLFALAGRRQGKAAPPPAPAASRSLAYAPATTDLAPPPAPPPRTAERRREVADFRRDLVRELGRGRVARAEKLYWATERLDLLAPFEAADALGALARYHFFDGADVKARALGVMGSELDPAGALDASWYGGLAAWRQGDCIRARELFARLAQSPRAPPRRRAAGGVWAARAALGCGVAEDVTRHLAVAAALPESFYGLIAARQLGLLPDEDWSWPDPGAEALANLVTLPGGRRAVALVEVGESFRADQELRLLSGRVEATQRPALLALAARLGLPASQLRLARALNDPNLPTAAHYPLPDWEPEGGFTIDRALIFALVRQESQFSARARSHAGASGLMQIMPATAGYIAGDRSLRWQRARLFDPDYNLALGQRYLDYLATKEFVAGNLFMLASAWNAGPGKLVRWQRDFAGMDDPLLFIESIPSPETRDFIEQVMANLWLYRRQLGQPTPTLDDVAAGSWPVYEALDGRLASSGEHEVHADAGD